MKLIRPNFLDSPFFVGEVDNWHLLPGAPPDVVTEFEEYMRLIIEFKDQRPVPPAPSLLDDLDL